MTRATFDAAGERVPLAEVERRSERVRVRDTAIMMYTSGTESSPKGCLLSHEAIVRNATCIADTRFELTPADRMWDPLPLFHNGGIVPSTRAWRRARPTSTTGTSTPTSRCASSKQERITVAHPAFETIWLAVLDHPRFPRPTSGHPRDSQRRRARAAALDATPAPARAAVLVVRRDRGGSHLALSRPDDHLEFGSRPAATRCPAWRSAIVDPDSGAEQPPGTEGEVLYRGPLCSTATTRRPS